MDSFDQPAWVHMLLREILAGDFARVELVVLNRGQGDIRPPPRGLGERLARYWKARRRALYVLHQKLEAWRFRPDLDATEMRSAASLLEGVPTLEVVPGETRFSDRLDETDVERIRDRDLDVLVRLGFRILRGPVLEAARHGVWSYHHGDNRENRGGPFGFWEVLEAWPTTGYIVQILTEDLDGGTVLHRGSVRTHPLSHHLSRNGLLWRSARALPRLLRRLHRLGASGFMREIERHNQVPAFYSRRLFRNPLNRELIGPLLRHLGRYVRRWLRTTLTWEQWQLRYGLRDGPVTSMWRMKSLVPPSDRFWADPCVVEDQNGYWVFFEEYLYANGRGRIAAVPVSADGKVGDVTVALDLDHHLSYPFVFRHEGSWYMIPESAGAGEVALYRADRLPGPWVRDRVLMTGVLADATLLHHEGRWWMFVTDQPHPDTSLSEELHVYYADSPLSTRWTPHPANPVVADVARARPAGRIFEFEGRLLRPAQDCSVSYGHAIHFQEILDLSPESYLERDATMLRPDWHPRVRGIHTWSHAGRLTMVDARVQRPGLPR